MPLRFKLGGRRVLHKRVAESRYSEVYPPHPNPKVPEPLEGGDEATCVTRGTCFESMTASLAAGEIPGQRAGAKRSYLKQGDHSRFLLSVPSLSWQRIAQPKKPAHA